MGEFAGGDYTEYKDGSPFYPMHLMAPTLCRRILVLKINIDNYM